MLLKDNCTLSVRQHIIFLRKKHPEINWKRLVELRNVIAHEYGETLMNRIWLAATDGLGELIKTLNELLAENTEE
jgi:uncharacterized protein with HEPN domain